MKALFVAVVVAVAGLSVAGCAPAYYVRAISSNGTVVCQASNGGVRTYQASGSALRSIRIGDRCPG